ncbi:hypothetical protein VTH06DRAFT_4643 [Thermothelomyces fergusii]
MLRNTLSSYNGF